MLTQEDIKNLLGLISRPSTTITAQEAIPVAILQQKLSGMVHPEKPEEKPEEKKK